MKSFWQNRKSFSPRPIGQAGKRITWLLLLILTSIVWIFIWSLGDEAPSQFGTGNVLSKIRLERLDGSYDDFSNYLGKIVVLNVWATWCPPCRREMPALENLMKNLNPEKVVVLGVSVDRKSISVREYLHRIEVTFANHIDRNQEVTKGLLRVSGLPSTFLFAKDGSIAKVIVGERQWDQEAIISALLNLYNDKEVDFSVFNIRG